MSIFRNGRIVDGSGGGGGSTTWTGLSDTPGGITADQVVLGDGTGTNLTFAPQSTFREGIVYSWADATARAAETGQVTEELGVQRDSGDVYRWDGASWSVFFNLGDGGSSALTSASAKASNAVSRASTIYGDVPDMDITPGAVGDYLVTFAGSIKRTGLSIDGFFQFAVDGVGVADTEQEERLITNFKIISNTAVVTVSNAAHAISLQWKGTSVTEAMEFETRSINAVKIG